MKFKIEIAATAFIVALAVLAACLPSDPPEPGAKLATPAFPQQQAFFPMFHRAASGPPRV